MELALTKALEWLTVAWPYIAMVLPFVMGLVALYLRGELENKARETVGAIYRLALHVAEEMEDEGLEWVRSPEGIAFRKGLAGDLYDLLPAKIGSVPVGLIKAVISREKWCAMVESAFQEMVELADKAEKPELPVATSR